MGEVIELPLKISGSNVFGRYPKISSEQTFNMITSDGWLTDYIGHKKVLTISQAGNGRGLYASTPFNQMIACVGNEIYSIDTNLNKTFIGTIGSSTSDVFIDENDAKQIGICDKSKIYIYDHGTDVFSSPTLDFTPGYIEFQDGYFIAPDINNPKWRLSAINNGLSWPAAPANIGLFQTKPDRPVACVRFPGKGNLLLVMGSTVSEPWHDLGLQLFPYQRSSSSNIDYGTLNPASIAESDTFIAWLGKNEKTGITIMYSEGGSAKALSTEGMAYKLGLLKHPDRCFAFMFQQDNQLFYQITFYDPDDNISYAFNFTKNEFYTVTDNAMNFHIAKRVVSFNNSYYFVSAKDGNLYQLDSSFTTYDGAEIPRIRVCNNIRHPSAEGFVVDYLNFTIEQGVNSTLSRVDMSISRDGGESFGSYVPMELNPIGVRKNRLEFRQLGFANDFVAQFRFWGRGRFVANDGVVGIAA